MAPRRKPLAEATWSALPSLPDRWLSALEQHLAWRPGKLGMWDLRLYTSPKGEERVAIPVRDSQGRLTLVRLLKPLADAYEAVNHPDTPGQVGLWPPPHLWPVLDNPYPVWLVINEAEALTGLSNGLMLTVGITGDPLRWHHRLNQHLRGLDVVIAFPHDGESQEAANHVSQQIAKLARSVIIYRWPEAFAGGAMARSGGPRLRDWFSQGHEASDLLALAENIEPIKAPPPEAPAPGTDLAALQDAANAMVRYKAWTAFDDNSAYRAPLLVHDLLSEYRIVVEADTGLIYIWEGRYWLRAVEAEIKRLIALKMGLAATKNRIAEAWGMLHDQVTMPRGESMDLRPELLCVNNGMLCLNTGRLLPHDPAYRCTHLFPYDWRPHDPPDCRLFKRTLREILPDPEVIDEVLEFMGYCLLAAQTYKKALLMVGPKDCGKSLLQEVIRQLLGPENCSAVNLAALEDQFQRVALHRKMANLCGETSGNFFGSENFKSLTGGDPVQAAYKGVDTFTFLTYAKQVYAANAFPRVGDQSEAFYERMLAINFPRQFQLGGPWVDPHRLERIIPQELPGIFHLAVARLYRLRRRGAFNQCRASFLYLNQYRLENDHVTRFVQERCMLQDLDGGRPEGLKSTVYAAYKTWCEDNGLKKPKDSSAFWKAIRQRNPQVELLDHGPTQAGGARPPWVVGLFLRELGQQAA